MTKHAFPVPQHLLDEKAEARAQHEPETKQYKVTGHRTVKGKKQGEVVELDLTPSAAAALVESGAIAPYDGEAPEPEAQGEPEVQTPHGPEPEDHPPLDADAASDEAATEEEG